MCGTKEKKELEPVHTFLEGLDARHNSAKGELLRMPEPSSLTTAFAYICKDESQQNSLKQIQVEVSSLAIQTKPPAPYQGSIPFHEQRSPPSSNRPKCTYCNDMGHVRDTCWKLHPHLKPQKQNPRNKGKFVANQLFPKPDFYGLTGHDHHTSSEAAPTASIVGRVL